MSEPVSDIIVYRTIILYGSLFQYINALHGCNIFISQEVGILKRFKSRTILFVYFCRALSCVNSS